MQSDRRQGQNTSAEGDTDQRPVGPPSISLPSGGGAIRGIGEKFAANPVTGTGSMSVPIATSPGRSGFGPQLSLSYDSGAGNGPFGLGWSLALPSITRKTDKGLPRYDDAHAPDEFILSGAEDLVPVLVNAGDDWVPETVAPRIVNGQTYKIRRYRPRIEGLFARIERWTNTTDPADSFWRSISRDNITTWYGKSDESRIADPADPARIFSWLICESHDDKGNIIAYGYKPEDSVDINRFQTHERNRSNASRSANRYIKHIRYGNRQPHFSNLSNGQMFIPLPDEWLFEVVFDYGEHDQKAPQPCGNGAWSLRRDPFSTYRAGFEVRTYRLCQRVLMFHHFPDEAGVGPHCLVRSTDFNYRYEQAPADPRNPVHTVLTSVTQCGYRRHADQSYSKKTLPPVEFDYSEVVLSTEIKTVAHDSIENLPYGVDGADYQWVDLNGEGLSGVLTEQGNAWFYKPNESPATRSVANGTAIHTARLGPAQMVRSMPAGGLSGTGNRQFLDLAGDGQLDVVELAPPMAGFYERRDPIADRGKEGWEPFRAFAAQPNIAWDDPKLKFIDLTGDGHADVLVTEEEIFTWYPSLAELGFGESERVHLPTDEERGPRIVFADGTQTLFQADFSGDGLTDIVRIRNGEVCYWPNLGYGRFGAKIHMDDAPWFDSPDLFDPGRIRLADIDGSGATDIIYLGCEKTRFWFNQAGNRWSAAHVLAGSPPVDNLASVSAVDLLGNGTACLVWSTPAPGAALAPMHYLELMAEGKPHLMIGTRNNLGAESRVRYAPSTFFYLQDKQAGNPWITRLPFPVHVVERVEIYDHISRNRFVTRYAYHHGYFDGVEREFRGFGMVEQYDTEAFASLNDNGQFPAGANVDETSHIPPVLTRTWFHTGVYIGRDRVSNFFAGLLNGTDRGEYFREPGLTDAQAKERLLDDTILPAGLTSEEERQACRALRGSMLRHEVYALDGTDKQLHPYTVAEQNFTIRPLQPMADNRHGVFFTHSNEVITYNYERNPADPRISHAITLAVDDYGNVLKTVAIGYGRRRQDTRSTIEDQGRQAQTFVTYTENSFTNAIDTADDHRTPLPCGTRSYELTGYAATGAAGRFQHSDFVQPVSNGQKQAHVFDSEIEYQNTATGGRQRRLIGHVRTLYRPDDMGDSVNDPLALLPFATLEPQALAGESYKLAFTPGLLAQVYRRKLDDESAEELLPNPADVLAADIPAGQVADRGGYVDLDGDGRWWVPSGRAFYSPDAGETAAQERIYAREHFHLTCRFRDPFGQTSGVSYDAYDLLIVETRDALDNRVLSVNDYRVLQPALVTDPNRNRSAVAFDTLGLVVGTAIMGKADEHLGDSLDGFEVDLSDAVVSNHLADPLTAPHAILNRATTRQVYDLFAYQRSKKQPDPQPAAAYTLARETHGADLQPGQRTKVQHSFSYSDGLGREIQKKIQAEPGPVPVRDGKGNIAIGHESQPETTAEVVIPRWVGSGWTVFNNKGKPVRQYEPFFTDTHRHEFDVRIGVSPVLFYDPLGRMVATLHPNHSWEKVVFDPWRHETWDVNDTVLISDPKDDKDIGEFFRRLPDIDYLPSWYAQRQGGSLGPQEQIAARKAGVHAGTATIAHADSLGRSFLTIAHNKFKRRDTSSTDPPEEEFYGTHILFDIEGHQREVIDAKDRTVNRYDYDLLGNRIHQASMEAGERWSLSDISGGPIRAWDSRGQQLRTRYDHLRRPAESFLRDSFGGEVLTERMVYGEDRSNPEKRNLRGRIVTYFDQAGIVSTDDYDFKGNLLATERQLAEEYKAILDWSSPVPLEAATYASRTCYDALNRPVAITTPDNSVVRPTYNQANLLETVEASLRGAKHATTFITNIDYDAKAQREQVEYGNGVKTSYRYDPLTFRLIQLITQRDAGCFPDDCPQPPPAGWPGCQVQNLHYAYDPVGNITHIRDDAQQTIYFRNRRVEPSNDYTYDAIYRLIDATGREHLGQGGAPIPHDPDDVQRVGLLQPGDGNAMGRYLEEYVYDAVGNILSVQHRGSDAAHAGWTRDYAYRESSQLDAGTVNNRLSKTTIGANTECYRYDGSAGGHGNITAMPHLPMMQWDYRDQLQATARQLVNGDGTPETAWYVYDAGGQRLRKVTERQAKAGQPPTRTKERVYLGGFEIYREYENDGRTATLERETLHVMDGIALVETRTADTAGDDPAPQQLVRYQFGNHLGSAGLELDQRARIISYEEYTPYGCTSYQAVRDQTETKKRYRYTGKERDEESDLYYHGARYYAPWVGRWVSPDPAGMADGTNLYMYVRNSPVMHADSTGAYCDPTTQSCVDPSEPTAREQALQQSLPEDERYLPPASFPTPTPTPSAPSVPAHPTAPQWKLGPRGEHIPTAAWQGGPLRDISQYDKPYAVAYAQQGNYEAAELAQNYLCATCHVLTKVDPRDFSIGGYSRGWQRGYIQGFVEVPLMANPIGGAWEIGVSGGQAITGESSGLHISNISSVLVDDYWDVGRKLSTGERVLEGGAFVVGAATLGWGAYASRGGQAAAGITRGGSGLSYADEVIEGGTGTVFSGHGELRPFAGTTTVPEGTSITLPRDGIRILDRTAHFIERGDWEGLARAAQADPRIARDIEGMATHLSGAEVPNYTLKAPTGLRVYSNSITVEDSTFLQDLLSPNQGNCLWAACTNFRGR